MPIRDRTVAPRDWYQNLLVAQRIATRKSVVAALQCSSPLSEGRLTCNISQAEEENPLGKSLPQTKVHLHKFFFPNNFCWVPDSCHRLDFRWDFWPVPMSQPAAKYHTKGCSRSSVDSPGARTLVFAAFESLSSCEFRASIARTPFCAIHWRSPDVCPNFTRFVRQACDSEKLAKTACNKAMQQL